MFYFNQCKLLIIFCLLAFSLSGCGGDSNIKSKDTPIPERKAPVVNAGEDQIITEESTVTLSAVATDSDGEIVTYLWAQVSGGDVQLNKTDLAEVTFSAPDLASAQTLIFKVEVTDDDGLKHSDEVSVEVKPFSQAKPIVPPLKKYAPTVNAGEDQIITEESTVTLSAVATDSDGEIVTYLWTQVSGGDVQLNKTDLAEVTFSAPDLASAQTLIFKVEVTDDDRLKHSDEVAVEVKPFSQAKPIVPPLKKYAPTVNAGPDQTVKETATVTLTSVATDTDGSIVTYKWTQTSGPSVPIDNNDKTEATFSTPNISKPETLEFEVLVTDSDGLTATDKVVVSLIPLILPTVNAGPDQTVKETATVMLASVATDTDGSIVAYKWTQTSGPSVPIDNNDKAEATFSAPDISKPETLEFEVLVTDSDGLTASDKVVVNLVELVAPTVNAGPDQTVKETATVTLTSFAADTDGSIVAYKWTQTSGPSVPIDNDDKAGATFSAPDISKPETLEFEVLVTDSDGLTASDKVVVNLVELVAPTVNAGPDQTVKETATVTLTSFAADTDGSIVAYKWTQTSGPSVPIDNDDKAGATFSAPDISKPETLEFKVVVTDSDGLTATDRVVVSLIPLILPTVNAGPDQTVKETATVTLTSVATDTDGSIVAYKWTQTSGPSVPIDNNDKAEATFSAPNIISIPETLEFEILVTDSDGLTALDIVTVTVDSLPVFTNVNVIAGDGEITLSWELNDDKQLDFIRYFNIKNGEKINLKTINGIHESRHSISGLTNGLPYYFQLVVSTPESARHVTEGIPKSPSTGLLNDTGLFYDDAFLKALEEQVPNNLMPKYCSDTDGIGQQDCSHGRNAQLLAGNLSRSGVSNFNNGFDFNALDATGNLHVDYQKPWTCVRDNHTGLVWEVKTKDGGIHDKNHKYRWGGKTAKGNGLGAYYPDWNVLVNGSNADYFCGYNDWRVPTLKELHSVVDYSRNAPAFDMNLFQNTNSMPHWTSSPFAESDEHAWYIFLYEPVGNKDKRENNHYVRLVRGGKH